MTHTQHTIETEKRKKEVPFVERLHESLVNHRIITDPRVVKSGTYYSWERYTKHRIQCGKIKECPICRERVSDYKRHQMLKTQEECLKDGGSLFLITGTLKHKRTDTLKFLHNKLSTAVRNLKNQKGWRKLQKQSSHPTRTVYECTYSEKNGYHPHVHMLFFADNQIINKTQIRNTLSHYWRNYTTGNLDVSNVDNPTIYLNKKEYDWVDLDELESKIGKTNRELKEHFTKSELETELVKIDNFPDYEPVISVEGILRTLHEMQDNQSYYKER
jgi:hypothetical protein